MFFWPAQYLSAIYTLSKYPCSEVAGNRSHCRGCVLAYSIAALRVTPSDCLCHPLSPLPSPPYIPFSSPCFLSGRVLSILDFTPISEFSIKMLPPRPELKSDTSSFHTQLGLQVLLPKSFKRGAASDKLLILARGHHGKKSSILTSPMNTY